MTTETTADALGKVREGIAILKAQGRKASPEMFYKLCDTLASLLDSVQAGEELIDLLEIMWDGYENGTPCYEDYDDPEQPTNFIGNAFEVDAGTEKKICDLLNRERPVNSKAKEQPKPETVTVEELSRGISKYRSCPDNIGEYLASAYPHGVIVRKEK